MALTTGQSWIDQTRSNLLGGYGEEFNKITNAYTAGDTTITFTYPMGNIAAGSYISIGLNIFYVWSVNAQVATVSGGQNGSTDVNLLAGTLARVNPKFTDWDIWQALATDLADLSSPLNGLFGMQYTDFTYAPPILQYDLGTSAAANLLDVYEVRHLTPGNFKDFGRISEMAWERHFNAVTADIASGMGIELKNTGGLVPSYKVRVYWKSAFVMPTDPTVLLSTSLMLASAYDLPPIGASIRLMAGREIRRNFTDGQGDVRRAMEVPPGAVAASDRGLQLLRQSRIDAEAARLLSMYPPYSD